MDSSCGFSHYNYVLSQVKQRMMARIGPMTSLYSGVVSPEYFQSGKMLRTRMVARLAECIDDTAMLENLITACAATELLHSATLCHDDIIDKAVVRRNLPTTWVAATPSAAVLTGDLLLCESIDLLQNMCDGRYVAHFIGKVREVCLAEIEQELISRGSNIDENACIRLARGKTGPLFAFLGIVFGGTSSALSSALEESGYLIGTAYQLADDLLDIVGQETHAGKTLGSDAKREKYTYAFYNHGDRERIYDTVAALCSEALNNLNPWPKTRACLEHYFEKELQPVFSLIDADMIIG
jgi:geranylgeranyl pyrophosphate synthase